MIHKFCIAALLLMTIQISAVGTTGGTTGEGSGEETTPPCHATFAEFSRC